MAEHLPPGAPAGDARSDAAIAEVIDLLDEMRRARGVARRGRFAVLATRAIAALTPGQRRQLAVDVASRAAPHLVERIDSESNVDLTPAQVRAVVEMVGNLDGDDVESLKAAIQDPEFQRRAAQRVVGAADAAIADAGVDLGDASLSGALPPPTPDARVVGPDEPRPGIEDDEEVEPPLPSDDLDEEVEPSPTIASGEDLPAPSMEEVEDAQPPRSSPAGVVPGSFEAYEHAMPEMAEWRPHGVDEDQLRFRRPRPRPRATVDPTPLPDVERSWFGDTTIGIATVEPARTELAERLRNADSARDQLRMFLDAADDVAGMSPAEQVGVLRALPATWVRRRAVLALIERGLLSPRSTPHVLAAFESSVARAWIVASLVEAGLGEVADYADLLTPTTAARLQRRYAA